MANILAAFELQKVVGGSSPQALQRYFHSRGLLEDIEDFSTLKQNLKTQAFKEHIIQQIFNLSKQETAVTLRHFQQAYALRDESAMLGLYSVLKIQNKHELLTYIEDENIKKAYDRVLYFIEHVPDIIDEYYLLTVLNHQSSRYWFRRSKDIKIREDDIHDVQLDVLKTEIQGKLYSLSHTKYCELKYVKHEGYDYVFAMVEDLPMTLPAWQDDGTHHDILLHPSFDVAFVYNREEGTLDVYSQKGGADFRCDMQLAFSKAVLGKEIEPMTEEEETYDLGLIVDTLINNKQFDFCTSEAQGVHAIFIRSINFLHAGYGNIKLDTKLNNPASGDVDDIYRRFEAFTKIGDGNKNTVDIKHLKPTSIEFRFISFDQSRQKDVTEKFTISNRGGCNLGFDGNEAQVRKCLVASGIQKSRNSDAQQSQAA